MMAFYETVRFIDSQEGTDHDTEVTVVNQKDDEKRVPISIISEYITDKIIDACSEDGGKVNLSDDEYMVILSSLRQSLDFYVSDFSMVEKAISIRFSDEDLPEPSEEQKMNAIRKTIFLCEYLEGNAPKDVIDEWMEYKKQLIHDAVTEDNVTWCTSSDKEEEEE